MKKHPNLLWSVALVLGWLFDFLFWKQAPGVNFAIYTALCLIGGFLILKLDQKRIARGALWLVPLILLFTVVTFIRAEPLTLFLALLLTLFLMAILAITFLGGRWLGYGLADYFLGFLRLAGSMIVRPLTYNAEIRKEPVEGGGTPLKLAVWPIVRGVLIALPVLVIFGALLASADIVFGNQLEAFVRFFRIEKLPEYIFRLVYILLAAYGLAGAFLHAALHSRDERLAGEGTPSLSQFLGFVEAAIVLGSVIVLFAAFVIVQFRYFFGGQANISLVGYTYSEYARRGFGELMAVAFFSLLMVLGLGATTRREDELQRRLFSGLSVAILALVTVMLVSAYQRLTLYELAYGFSRLRAYTHVLLVWMGLLLAGVVLLEVFHRERAFAVATLIASLGFAASLSALNVDGFIARQNAGRAVDGEHLDVPYLVSLSTDAVPTMSAVFESSSYPGSVREAVGAALTCRLQEASARSSTDWRSFSLSRWQAEIALDRLRAELAQYHVVQESAPTRVITPAGNEFNCYGFEPD